MTAQTASPAKTSGNNHARRYAGSQLRTGSTRRAIKAGLSSTGIAGFSLIGGIALSARATPGDPARLAAVITDGLRRPVQASETGRS